MCMQSLEMVAAAASVASPVDGEPLQIRGAMRPVWLDAGRVRV